MTNDKDCPQAASSEVAKTYLAQVIIQDGDNKRDVNEVARYLFSSQITQVSERVLIILGLADEKNAKGLVTALLQRNYIKASCKDGFYTVVPIGLPPRKKTKIKTLTGGERMARAMANDQEFLHFVKSSWCDVAWSIQRAGFNIFDRFPGTALVGDDRYINPVTASRALCVLIEDGIIFAHSDTHYRLTDKARKILDSKRVESILPIGGVSRSVGDKKHLKTLRRDLREIAVALNTWEFKRDDNRLAAVLVKLWRNSQLEIVKSVDNIFAACEELVASNNFVFRKGDGFVIKPDDEELRVRMLAANAVTHSPTQRPCAPTVAQAPVARPPSRDERRGGRTFLPFPPRVPDPVKLPPKPQPVAHSAPAVPVPAQIIPPVVVTAPIPVPAPAPVLAASDAAVAVSSAAEPIFSTFDQAVQSGDLAVGDEVVVPAASITISSTDLALDDSSISFTDAKLIVTPIESTWVSYVKTQYNSTTWTRIHLVIGITKGLQYMTPSLIEILVDKFGLSRNGAYQVIYDCTKKKGLAISRRVSSVGGQLVTWQKSAIADYESFLRQLIGGFAASLLTGFTGTAQPKSVPVPADVPVPAAVPVTVAVVYAESVQPINIDFVGFIVTNYDHTVWSNHDFFYVVTRGMPYESLDLVNVVSQFTNHVRHWVTERIFTSTSRGLSKAVRHGVNRRSGKTIFWCDGKISKDTKDLLQQVESHYTQHCKNVKKPDAAPAVSESSMPPPAAENADLVLSMAEVERLTSELEKASAEADRLNKSLVAEQTAHRETAKQLRDEQAAHEATDTALTESQRSLKITTEQFKLEQAAHRVTLAQLQELIDALSVLQKFIKGSEK